MVVQTARRSLLGFSLFALAIAAAGPTSAQPYPSGTIRIIVAGAAGTPPDVISRIVANDLAESEGWRIVVENKPGAMQTIAGAEVLKQPADGYTIISTSLPGMLAPVLLPNVGYRLDSDFAPVIKLATLYNVLVVNPSVAATSLRELIELLKSQPDKFTYSSGGFGTPAHLAGELFKYTTGVSVTHVPYPALPRALADLLGGVNQYQFITTVPVLDLIATGRLRALAVTAPNRLPHLKDVPTVVEEGYPQLVVQDWSGYLVKKGTPNEVVARLNAAIDKALAKPNVREALAKLGAQPAGGSAAEFGDFVKSQLAYWSQVVKDSGMKMQP
jgi:tripartite-type tricarboxylate transporter receptor subunit TctC